MGPGGSVSVAGEGAGENLAENDSLPPQDGINVWAEDQVFPGFDPGPLHPFS